MSTKARQLSLSLAPGHTSQQPGSINIVRLQMVREKTLPYAKSAITCPEDLAQLVHSYLGEPDREYFIVICLDTKNKPTHIETVHIGSLMECSVHPREVFKLAIMSNAASVALVHNHPSGDIYPSENDTSMTKKLANAGKILGISVLDHIIMGHQNKFYSFKDNNLL
jgi:DNA repair protein RadC